MGTHGQTSLPDTLGNHLCPPFSSPGTDGGVMSKRQSRALDPRVPGLRRTVFLPAPPRPSGTLRGRSVKVLGQGPLAIAVSRELLARGALLHREPELVVDACSLLEQSATHASAFAASHPPFWFTLLRCHAEPESEDLDSVFQNGARAGLANYLAVNWRDCSTCIVRLDTTLSHSEAANAACDELTVAHHHSRIFKGRERRLISRLVPDSISPSATHLTSCNVILVTVDPQGLVLPLVEHLAVAFSSQDSACKVALVTPTSLATRGRPSSHHRAQHIVQRLESQGFGATLFQRDLHRPGEASALIHDIQSRFGQVDGCLHGMYLGFTPPASFGDSTMGLFESLNDSLESCHTATMELFDELQPSCWLISMGTADAFLARLREPASITTNTAIAWLSQHRPRSAHVHWQVPPGGDSAQFRATASILSCISGRLAPENGTHGQEFLLSTNLQHIEPRPAHPFVDEITLLRDRVEANTSLGTHREPWLCYYSLGANTLLPCSIAIEIMAAMAFQASPGQGFFGLEDLRMNPTSFGSGSPIDLLCVARPLEPGRASSTLYSITDDARKKLGSATIHLDTPSPIPPIPSGLLPDAALSGRAIYDRFFQGGTFKVLKRVTALAEDILLAEASVEHAYLAAGLLTWPLSAEVAFQAAALHRMIITGQICIPTSVHQMSLLRTPSDGSTLTALARQLPNGLYDVDLDSPLGTVLRLRGLSLEALGQLAPYERFSRPAQGWPKAIIGEPASHPSGSTRSVPTAQYQGARKPHGAATELWSHKREPQS